ncbi:hypothetical protein DA2_1438 [Desulfovibrio sp. A2]|nr:hypothetical protein DA2_1438 [Desulfovibrio sp. A2]
MPSASRRSTATAAQGRTASLFEQSLVARGLGEELVMREINRRWEQARAQGALFDMNPARGTACVRRVARARQ